VPGHDFDESLLVPFAGRAHQVGVGRRRSPPRLRFADGNSLLAVFDRFHPIDRKDQNEDA
jgi:hypothetical protein